MVLYLHARDEGNIFISFSDNLMVLIRKPKAAFLWVEKGHLCLLGTKSAIWGETAEWVIGNAGLKLTS